MTQNEKNLLLQDICSRLPYGVICKSVNFKNPTKLVSIDLDGPAHDVYFCTNDDGAMWNDYDEIKPYLFPLSSMTEEQYYEMMGCSSEDCLDHMEMLKSLRECTDFTHWPLYEYRVIDWFVKNHFDYRGLIPMGLANDATGKNIY